MKMRCSGITRISLLIVFFWGSLAPLSSTWGRLAPYDGIGGPGGNPFSLECGQSAILVGIIGRSGSVIDQLGGLCVKIDPASGTWVGGVYETARAGGNGGVPFKQVCSVGEALAGIEGATRYFSGTLLVSSLKIVCIRLRIRIEDQPSIMGYRLVGIYGDHDPLKTSALQDLCYPLLSGTNRSQDQWSPVGLKLEGRSGVYLDRIHIHCGSLPFAKEGYKITFAAKPSGVIPEGTPLKITWRATGPIPELTPPLQASWVILDHTHSRSGVIGSQPAKMTQPCAFAKAPCIDSWTSSLSGFEVTFLNLPPAKYSIVVTVRPNAGGNQSEGQWEFEVKDNILRKISLSPNPIGSGSTTTATFELVGPAPLSGKTIYLSSSNSELVPIPETLVIPEGTTSATLLLKANSLTLAGQTTIRASTRKPVKALVPYSANSKIFQRGIPDTREISDQAAPEEDATEHQAPILEGPAPEPLPLTDEEKSVQSLEDKEAQDASPLDSQVTERGIKSFGKRNLSSPTLPILSLKPNQGTMRTTPEGAKTPPPPGVPIPYPNIPKENVLSGPSSIQERMKIDTQTLSRPGSTKEIILTVQSSANRINPTLRPTLPSLQK